MTKIKNIHIPLVVTGYILFTLLVLTVILSTIIPFSTLLLHPYSIKLNVAIAMVALTIGAVLPVLVGYFVGDRSVKSKSRLAHHFNGILFGLLAYWIMTIVSFYVSLGSFFTFNTNTNLIVNSIVPTIAVAIVVFVLAILHIRSKNAQRDVLYYKPYTTMLVISILAMPLLTVFISMVGNSLTVYPFVELGLVGMFALVSYASLTKTTFGSFKKLAWAAVSVSVLYLSFFVMTILQSAVVSFIIPYPTMQTQLIGGIVGLSLALLGWTAYWTLQVRVLRTKH